VSQPYIVSYSELIAETIDRIVLDAIQRGQGDAIADDLMRLKERLRRSPGNYGESRFKDVGSGLALRIVFEGSLCATIGIHEESRNVFIGRIQAMR
jgi:hypothetical protein